MKYKCTIEISEDKLTDVLEYCKDIVPVYSDSPTYSDYKFIINNVDRIFNSRCSDVYERYQDENTGRKILSKLKFYDLVKTTTHAKIVSKRIGKEVFSIFINYR